MKDKQVMERKTGFEELHLVSCGYEKCVPEHSYGPAVRRYYTIHFILKGQGHFYINEKHYVIGENQCFLIPTDVLTLYRADKENPWTYVWVCFNGTMAAPFLEHCHLTADTPVQVLSCAKDIQQIIFDMMEHPALTPENECYIQSGLFLLFAKLKESAHASYKDTETNDNFYISQAMEYILKNTFLNLTVNDVADYLHISRSYLFTLFKKHLHTSPQKFLTSAKISNARELLSKTDIPIANIAVSSGYQNPFAFSRAFRQEMGMTPSEYREKYRKNEEIFDY